MFRASTILACVFFLCGVSVFVAILGYRLSTTRCPDLSPTATAACDQEKHRRKRNNWRIMNNSIGWAFVGFFLSFCIFLVLFGRESAQGKPLESLPLALELSIFDSFVAGEEVLCRWVKIKGTDDAYLVLAKDFPPIKEGTTFTVKNREFFILEESSQVSNPKKK